MLVTILLQRSLHDVPELYQWSRLYTLADVALLEGLSVRLQIKSRQVLISIDDFGSSCDFGLV